MGHRQTVHPKFRHRTACSIKIFGKKRKIPSNTPKMGNGLFPLIRVGKLIPGQWVKVSYCDQSMSGIHSASLILNVSVVCRWHKTFISGAQWLSWLSVRLGIEGLLVPDSLTTESLCCVLEQDTLSAA